MKHNDKLDTFIPMGKLFVRDFTYFLIRDLDDRTCERDFPEFTVVPITPIRPESLESNEGAIFSWARLIKISGDFLIDYGYCNSIQCLRPPEEW
jgi:hypothetical protein